MSLSVLVGKPVPIFPGEKALTPVFAGYALRQRDAVTRQQGGEGILHEKRVFLLPQGGKRIELLELRVDEARVTHHHAAVREPVEKLRKGIRKIRLVAKRISAREGRIGAHAQRRRAAAEAAAQNVEQRALAVVECANERL